MSGNEPVMIGESGGSAAPEIFALTDEQILGMEAEGQEVEGDSLSRVQANAGQGPSTAAANAAASARDDSLERIAATVAQEPPGWLAREMKDPWVGDEARELWEGVQKAEREMAAYREAFGSPEDAWALKEIYPGGVAEAKGAAARARELAEIDEVFFGAAGKPAEELRAGRVALVEKLYAQDPGAFREMVEAGIRLLEGAGGGKKVASDEWRVASEKSGRNVAEKLTPGENNRGGAMEALRPEGLSYRDGLNGYREFERATNAELEKSVGGTIARAMDAALPNLRHVGGEGQALPLQERLLGAVREEVETALRSDASLGEQVARVLSGRRFDEAARAQVVRLIDARAQQLVPGAVRKVVGSWTAATLGGRRREPGAESSGRGELERRGEGPGNASQARTSGEKASGRNERDSAGKNFSRGRVDYRKYSDEQILGM